MFTIQAFHNGNDTSPAITKIEMDFNVAKRVLRKLMKREPLATAHGVIYRYYEKMATAIRTESGEVVIQ